METSLRFADDRDLLAMRYYWDACEDFKKLTPEEQEGPEGQTLKRFARAYRRSIATTTGEPKWNLNPAYQKDKL